MIAGRNVGAEQNEPDWSPEQMSFIRTMTETVLPIQSVLDTRRSVMDSKMEFVAQDPTGSIVPTEAAYASVRDRVDTSTVTTVSSDMRYQCMAVTMDLIKNLESMSSGDKFESTVRGLMMISYGVPIKVMNVGLYPYEQNILPPIATALAYSPVTCTGSTPSVQILSQAMAGIGIHIKEKIRRRKKNKDPFQGLSEVMLLSRFAMMLRCSYVCTTVGVAFTNCVPVPVDTMAKKMKCASFLSEWLGEMIMIHKSFGFKMTIMAMGAFAADTVRRTFSSYRGTAEMSNYIGNRPNWLLSQKHVILEGVPDNILDKPPRIINAHRLAQVMLHVDLRDPEDESAYSHRQRRTSTLPMYFIPHEPWLRRRGYRGKLPCCDEKEEVLGQTNK